MTKTSPWFMVLTFSISIGTACGSGHHGTADGGADAGASGRGGAKAMDGGAGKAGTGMPRGQAGSPSMSGVACGSNTCQLANSMFAGFIDACCVDPAKGTCGMSAMGAACAEQAPADPRCPSVDLMGVFMLSSCCTSDQCGIDASMFGMGCISLAEAASAAGAMGMGSGLGGVFPEPRACNNSGSDSDAGGADSGT